MIIESDMVITQITIDGKVYEVDPPLPAGRYVINVGWLKKPDEIRISEDGKRVFFPDVSDGREN
jgi:hypothetical protein